MNDTALNNEYNENRIAANKSVAFFILEISAFILDITGIFYVEKRTFIIQFSVYIVSFIIIQILGRVPAIASNKKTKYVIMFFTFIITLVTLVLLNFFAILVLCYPMIIAFNYHSSKIPHFTFASTIICAMLWPILGWYFNFWQPGFFVFLLDAIDPGIINGTPLEVYRVVFLPDVFRVFLYISLPQVGFAGVFGIIMLISNKINQKNYIDKINELRESRDSILAGMADVIESRDYNTGGHVKRTSEVVKLLVKSMNLDEQFAECIIITAPMHDIGKIAIADSILNKPGKYTPEEYEIIKEHTSKSIGIFQNILVSLKDEQLITVAKNIALYHHEHYDGKGYPCGLNGEEIPLEARIMAIADVYDALVSKRCYKETMSHEQAYAIIKESMGSHFDPNLFVYFDKAYDDIVKYYSD